MKKNDDGRASFAKEVRHYLTLRPKQLPSKYFYDALGSHLFEAICQLPEYPITRAERSLLARFAPEMVEPLADPVALVELGCGSGEKIATIASALRGRGAVRVHLIDISDEALELSRRTLGRLPYVSATGLRGTFEAGLQRVARERAATGTLLVLFLGSNIGNFDPPAAHEFLVEVRSCLRPSDGLLLGTDLVKPERELLAAYDDPIGVTAAFDKNILYRINRELGGDFDLARFTHRAIWNEATSCVEMHLVSERRQTVRIAAADLVIGFEQGESIWTESSHKYTPESAVVMGERAGFKAHGQWIEPKEGFAVTSFIAT
jgi:L-histidine Nalpha-methyltransferase